MITFLISLFALILGYFLYGKFVDKVFGPDKNRMTPANETPDGVDYVAMPTWKVFLIQFLNIAGTGPIFGAIMGAKFGPSAYLWIVFGSIFAGGVHDYFSGMLSVRHNGTSIPNIVGYFLGKNFKVLMLFFSLLLLLLVGTVFVYSPAIIFNDLAGGATESVMIWVGAIFLYYILATMLPVDKLIGRLYPVFGFALLFMALSLMVCLIVKWPSLPEVWQGLGNKGAAEGLAGMSSQPIFPCLFITIACGALSGFHSTQSPIMSRCLKNEAYGRPVFYGAMITEGIVALIWATVASYFYFGGGAAETGADVNSSAPAIVNAISTTWLGVFGGILAILGVVAAPITSGDTAFRSARLILSDFLKINQQKKANRLMLAIPLFCLTSLLLWFNISDEMGFNIIWRYFGWANQTLACFTLWASARFIYIRRPGMKYLVCLIPAVLMTAICIAYICIDKIGFHMPYKIAWAVAVISTTLLVALFARKSRTQKKSCA